MSGPFMLIRTLAVFTTTLLAGTRYVSWAMCYLVGCKLFWSHVTMPYRFKAAFVGPPVTLTSDSHS